MRFAYGLTGDLAEAQDFTQEAYARAWQRWRRDQLSSANPPLPDSVLGTPPC
ncbi:MAG TPA: hypothetical protein DGG94_11880 [Micromonosporaceae bacterium]|nr:hypothetical protein [Micromonosporaceae bacterium]